MSKVTVANRLAALEEQVNEMQGLVTVLQRKIDLMSPKGINTSLGKSVKTSVVQLVHWNRRRGISEEQARPEILSELRTKFGSSLITKDIVKYIDATIKRVYAKAVVHNGEEPTTTAPPETFKTAGEA